MSKKTIQSKSELANVAAGNTRPERLTLSETRNKIFDRFYNNLRVLVATQELSMVDLSRKLGLKSGSRISDLCYGRGTPSAEELIVLANHFKCALDDLLYKSATITWQEDNAIPW